MITWIDKCTEINGKVQIKGRKNYRIQEWFIKNKIKFITDLKWIKIKKRKKNVYIQLRMLQNNKHFFKDLRMSHRYQCFQHLSLCKLVLKTGNCIFIAGISSLTIILVNQKIIRCFFKTLKIRIFQGFNKRYIQRQRNSCKC